MLRSFCTKKSVSKTESLQLRYRLETLCLEMVYVYGVNPNIRFAWHPPLEEPTCLMKTIIRVEVKGFRLEDGEGWPLINYLQQISTEIREFQIIIQ
ncbi:unnamed protein product [Prunus armeniaca]|uniref:Uncharacterized protein n=1 Tax=Prunus armeniaca TaxID=36596 RepID=A0A6J5W503_PRUAR|nr:unnamed protein product [Prunus armeniaca]